MTLYSVVFLSVVIHSPTLILQPGLVGSILRQTSQSGFSKLMSTWFLLTPSLAHLDLARTLNTVYRLAHRCPLLSAHFDMYLVEVVTEVILQNIDKNMLYGTTYYDTDKISITRQGMMWGEPELPVSSIK